MFLNPNQTAELLRIVDVYSVTFLANTVGTDILTDGDKTILKNAGFSTAQISNATTQASQAFKFGMLSMALGDNAAKSMTYEKFKGYLRSGKFFPLSNLEQNALQRVKQQIAGETRRLSGDMKSDLERKMVVVDRGRPVHSKTVMSAAKRAIEDRKSVSQLASEIGELTGKWHRDIGRMSDYVMHDAFNEGRVAQIDRGSGKVYFDVYPGACKYCVKLYLTSGVGTQPKVFDTSELRANGSNVGRKQANWKATIGPVHPWCRCTANELPDGYVWDDKKASFVPDPNFRRKVNRRSKVSVTVDNETTEI